MTKKTNPLLDALESRKKQSVSKLMMLELSDLPAGTKSGDAVMVSVSGVVQSVGKNGSVQISVTSVESDDEEDESSEEAQTSKVLRVQTQESNYGGS